MSNNKSIQVLIGTADRIENLSPDYLADGQRELLERISGFVIKLKTDWKVLSKEEIREKLTEFICELDKEIN